MASLIIHRVGVSLMILGTLAFLFGGAAFTSAEPLGPFWGTVANVCFLGWWIPFAIGAAMAWLAQPRPRKK